MKSIAIIPARYASTRFPGKPLAKLGKHTVVEWVYRGVSDIECIDEVCVATDDSRIAEAVKAFGGKCLMTRADHRSGTERCGEAISKMAAEGKRFDVVVNVQGDEPFVNREQIETLLASFENKDTDIATLAKKITTADELMSPNNVKVVADRAGWALYFSRAAIPFIREAEPSEWVTRHVFFKHIGIYAYKADTLRQIARMQPSRLELAESLEQLRWLENGLSIHMAVTDAVNVSIDTPADLVKAEQLAVTQTLKEG